MSLGNNCNNSVAVKKSFVVELNLMSVYKKSSMYSARFNLFFCFCLRFDQQRINNIQLRSTIKNDIHKLLKDQIPFGYKTLRSLG